MKKRNIGILILMLISPLIVTAAPPSKPDGNMKPGDNNSLNITYKAATTFSTSKTEDSKTYTSTTGGENALLVSDQESVITNPIIKKVGDETSENSDFYGTNAGILVYKNGILNITGGTITTDGSHANAVFSYGTGKINLNNTKIYTTKNNSGGIMVAGGGSITANNLEVKTSGNSSAAIRSDRGGGVISVESGVYETSGVGSPVIYSTANITVNNASLNATKSEGVVVEGANSVTLNNTTLSDSNTTLNGNSETYKNIFLYQSMSGDAESGVATFTAKDSTIKTLKGDTIFVTNTKAVINLEANEFENTDGDFLRIQTGKWGNSGSNGGVVTLNLKDQIINGSIVVDNISSLDIKMEGTSIFKGSIDNDNQAKKITLTMSKDSTLNLEKDTYLDELSNEDSTNTNIYSNGFKLIVAGEEITTNTGTYQEIIDSGVIAENGNNNFFNDFKIPIIVLSLGVILLVFAIILKRFKKKS